MLRSLRTEAGSEEWSFLMLVDRGPPPCPPTPAATPLPLPIQTKRRWDRWRPPGWAILRRVVGVG